MALFNRQQTQQVENGTEETKQDDATITDDNKEEEVTVDIWAEPEEEKKEVKEVVLSDADKEKSAKSVFEDMLANVKFEHEDIPQEQIEEMFRNNDVRAFRGMMDNVGVQTFKQTMLNVAPMIRNAMDQVEARVLSKVGETNSATKAVDAMYEAIPSARSKNIGPVAESALGRLMDKGHSLEKSIQGVKAFLQEAANLSLDDTKEDFRSPATPGSGNNALGRRVKADDVDWAKELGFDA